MSGLLALAFAAGMVAPVNPCGFALLPAWITLSAGDARTHALQARLIRALNAGLALTIGFAGTLVVVGLVVSGSGLRHRRCCHAGDRQSREGNKL